MYIEISISNHKDQSTLACDVGFSDWQCQTRDASRHPLCWWLHVLIQVHIFDIARGKGLNLICIGLERCATRVMTTCVFRLSPRRCVFLARFAPRALIILTSLSYAWRHYVVCVRVCVQVNGVARGTALLCLCLFLISIRFVRFRFRTKVHAHPYCFEMNACLCLCVCVCIAGAWEQSRSGWFALGVWLFNQPFRFRNSAALSRVSPSNPNESKVSPCSRVYPLST